ncbi:hypothetical protein Q7P37_007492 [Cladosporium fusiforme]
MVEKQTSDTIGVARNVLDSVRASTDEPVLKAFEQAVAEIEAAGAVIVDANFTVFEAWQSDGNSTLVLNADFLANLRTYLSELTQNPNNITNLAQLSALTRAISAEGFPDRNPAV